MAIQTAYLALAEGPHAFGDKPDDLDDLTPSTTTGADPADLRAYDDWDHVDFVLDEAEARGLIVAVAPFRQQWLPRRDADAGRYARFLGGRHVRRPNLIWMVGFDTSAEQVDARIAAYRAVARGIAEGASGCAEE